MLVDMRIVKNFIVQNYLYGNRYPDTKVQYGLNDCFFNQFTWSKLSSSIKGLSRVTSAIKLSVTSRSTLPVVRARKKQQKKNIKNM